MQTASQFDAAQYATDAGWDYASIEATAQKGVADEDRRIIATMVEADEVDAAVAKLLAMCVERVAYAS